MVKISVKEDCGNAPKKGFIRDFQIAYAKGNIENLLEFLDKKVVWNMVGYKTFDGIETVDSVLPELLKEKPTEMVLENIITHGNVGAANGFIVYTNGEKIGFCDVFEFTSHAKSAKLKKITSYAVDIKES